MEKTGACSPQGDTSNPIIPTSSAHPGPTVCQAQPAYPQRQRPVKEGDRGLQCLARGPAPDRGWDHPAQSQTPEGVSSSRSSLPVGRAPSPESSPSLISSDPSFSTSPGGLQSDPLPSPLAGAIWGEFLHSSGPRSLHLQKEDSSKRT